MSSLQYDTIKPFRKNKDTIPQTVYGEWLRTYPDTNKCPAWHGVIKVDRTHTLIQWIPMDSPVYPWLGSKGNEFLYDKNLDEELTNRIIDEWEINEEEYSKDDVLYKVNTQGFRCDTIVKSQGKDAIMFLGDSFTFGIASANDDVWCSKVCTKLGKINWNVGNPGGTNQDIVLLFESFVESGYIPSHVVVMWTSPVRKLIFNGNKFNNFTQKGNVQDIDDDKLWNDEVGGFIADIGIADTPNKKAWAMMADKQMWFDFYMQRQSLIHLCASLGIKLTEMHYKSDTSIFCHNIDGKAPLEEVHVRGRIEYPDNKVIVGDGVDNQTIPCHFGRDGMHWGSTAHDYAYKTCINLINS